ncbi:MAG TPA: hypothetical protein DEF72_01195 [Gammaproteobacteria bacterium]|nr:hypothetical protein [Gammaproteobacteria bacterium]
MSKLNKALMATTAIAFAAGLAMPAAAKKKDPSKAPKVVSSGKKMKLKLYGQIARTASITDDGSGTGFQNAENGNTSTRMGVKAAGKINNDLKLKLRYEWNMRSGHENNQLDNISSDNDFDIRWADIQFHHKRFGTLFFGRGDGPGNSASQTDLSGTSTGQKGGGEHWDFQNARFLETSGSANGGGRATTRVARVFGNMDATSRQNRIRYDTPSIYGFQFRAGVIDQSGYEFALWYKGKVAGMKIKGAVNYSHNKSGVFPGEVSAGTTGTDTEISLVNGSLSVHTPWGIGVSGAAGTNDRDQVIGGTAVANDGKDPFFWWAAVWYRAKFFELGETRFKYGFQTSVDNQNEGDIGQAHGFTIVQQIKSTGTDMYAGYRHVSVDRDAAGGTAGAEIDFEDQDIWVLGFRARF